MSKLLDNILAKQAEYYKAVEADGRQVVAEVIADIFKLLPTVTSLRWTQYTPYFNDGDATIFGVNELEFSLPPPLRPAFAQESEGGEEDDYEFISSWDVKETLTEVHTATSMFGNIPDIIMERTFGDHVRVTVSRHKQNDFVVEEYSHD